MMNENPNMKDYEIGWGKIQRKEETPNYHSETRHEHNSPQMANQKYPCMSFLLVPYCTGQKTVQYIISLLCLALVEYLPKSEKKGWIILHGFFEEEKGWEKNREWVKNHFAIVKPSVLLYVNTVR